MYLMIWNTCNMTCEHCCIGAITGKTPKMNLAMVRKAVDIANEYGDHIVIGGGEPTLHPDFAKILLFVIGHNQCDVPPLIVTNGSNKEISMALLAMAENGGVIDVELSQDMFHDSIDEKVVEAFKKARRIRNTENSIVGNGRGREYLGLEEGEEDDKCCCPTWQVQPDGVIKQCGCDRSPVIGNLDDGISGPIVLGECYRSSEYKNSFLSLEEDTEINEVI